MSFHGYYKKETRGRYLQAALNHSGISSWAVLDRHNPACDHPSDFDVLKVRTCFHFHLCSNEFCLNFRRKDHSLKQKGNIGEL